MGNTVANLLGKLKNREERISRRWKARNVTRYGIKTSTGYVATDSGYGGPPSSGYPVAMKILSPDISRRVRRGGSQG